MSYFLCWLLTELSQLHIVPNQKGKFNWSYIPILMVLKKICTDKCISSENVMERYLALYVFQRALIVIT